MRDFDVRTALRRDLDARFADDPHTRIIEELGICQGSVRIDVAVANCALHGYEIKSAADTLERLPAQAAAYCKVFDHVTLVTAGCHLGQTAQLVPAWWGIVRATELDGETYLETVRVAEDNPSTDSYSIAQLLWRQEALDLLELIGHARGIRSKPREYAWDRLSQVMPPEQLKQQVRERLKSRESWRVAEPRA